MKKQMSALGGASVLVLAIAASATVLAPAATPVATKTAIGVVAAATPTPTPAPVATVAAKTSTTVAATTAVIVTPVVPVVKPAALAPLNLTDMALWNWNGKWMASEWANANSPLPWRYNHVVQLNRADTTFTLDANGAPELQALNGTAANGSGLWETDVTLPTLKDGLIVAPLWVYDATSRDEIDFEFAGRKGLDLTMHSVVQGVAKQNTIRLFAGVDMSGQRKRFGIKVDQTAGFVEMYVDSVLVYRWNKSTMSFFISKPLKPWIEMWPAITSNSGFVTWAGKWPGLAAGEKLSMVVHGYGYTPLTK